MRVAGDAMHRQLGEGSMRQELFQRLVVMRLLMRDRADNVVIIC
jgi:hypothetical protein